MNELYPFKFKPILKEKIWGGQNLKAVLNKNIPENKKIGESWEISCVSENISVIDNGYLAGNNLSELIEIYMGDLVGDRIFELFGTDFPLLIKFLDANDILSIQVHPDDELAQKRHNSFGKTEMWYIIDAKKDSDLISGFNCQLDKSIYLNHLNNKKLPAILNYEKVKNGDVFFIPAGRIHAIGSGIVLAEIQQTSDTTYRIYDWDRKDDNGNLRELHTELALDAIDYNFYNNYKTIYSAQNNKTEKILSTKYFETNIIEFDCLIEKNYNQLDSFVIFMCLEGKFIIDYEAQEAITVEKGETVLIPAVIEHLMLKPVVQCRLLEVYIPEPDVKK